MNSIFVKIFWHSHFKSDEIKDEIKLYLLNKINNTIKISTNVCQNFDG